MFFISCTSKIRVKYVYDGDTIITTKYEHIRLAEIDAPERYQDEGLEAKQFLSSLILGKTIEIKRMGKDRYNRTIGKLYLNGLYINEYMVVNGEAWSFRYHGNIFNEEQEARKQKKGLWRFSNPEAPYKYRLQHKY
ncbi:MAG TPA: thermonuclease family protein [Candidatus Sulfopaludibacter sp.]|nr:thermonuclease family protein [Candidatus Sulfopaludibacter sp.]